MIPKKLAPGLDPGWEPARLRKGFDGSGASVRRSSQSVGGFSEKIMLNQKAGAQF
jgi:hypothetical protein